MRRLHWYASHQQCEWDEDEMKSPFTEGGRELVVYTILIKFLLSDLEEEHRITQKKATEEEDEEIVSSTVPTKVTPGK